MILPVEKKLRFQLGFIQLAQLLLSQFELSVYGQF